MKRLLLAALLTLAAGCGSTGDPGKTLGVSIGTNNIALRVTNKSSAEAVGHQMEVYLNGQPPFTFHATGTVPAVGQSTDLSLREFVKKDGTRFNPLTQAVTEVWVGGNGYDYRSFKMR